MKARNSLLLLLIGSGLVFSGCAGWKNQMGTWQPGQAATMPPANAAYGAPAPGFNQAPPPPPSSYSPVSPNSSLAPLDGPQKLDLSSVPEPGPSRPAVAASSGSSAAPTRMYNLEKPKPATKVSSKSSKSSALTKLASAARSKSSSSEKTVASKSSSSAIKKISSSSAVKKLSASASSSSLPKPSAKVEAEASPAPQAQPAAPKTADEPIIDTTLLAQPVRKGAGDESDSSRGDSKGPQSRVLPRLKFFEGKAKPTIYPVSNPVSSEPVDVVRFS